MSPEREPMENDSNSCTAEELEQQTVDVYVERALHGPVFRAYLKELSKTL